MEAATPEAPEKAPLSEEHAREIFDRLAPAGYETSLKVVPASKDWSGEKPEAWTVHVAGGQNAAALAALLALAERFGCEIEAGSYGTTFS